MAQLEVQRSRVNHDEARLAKENESLGLSMLWGENSKDIVAISDNNALNKQLMVFHDEIVRADSSSRVRELLYQKGLVREELNVEITAARPSVTLSGGVKRLRSDRTNSFVFGISLPVPLFNRNQGNIRRRIRQGAHPEPA